MQIELLRFDGRAWSRPFPSFDSDRTLLLVFGASSYLNEPEPLSELAGAFPSSHIVGCSSSGEIFEDVISDGSLSVAIAQFAGTDLRVGVAAVGTQSSKEAGAELARQLSEPDLVGVLVLSEGLDVNGSDLVEGLNENLPGVTITGGLAGDGDRFEQTWTLVDGKPASGFVTAVGFYGDRVQIGHGSKGGWDRFGPERIVTRSERQRAV